jgi:hypothetical protein
MKKVIKFYKEKINPILTPKMIFSIALAWFIVAGWSLVFIAASYVLKLDWMFSVGIAWQTFLWLPFVIDSPIIVGLAILLHNIIFKQEVRIWQRKKIPVSKEQE